MEEGICEDVRRMSWTTSSNSSDPNLIPSSVSLLKSFTVVHRWHSTRIEPSRVEGNPNVFSSIRSAQITIINRRTRRTRSLKTFARVALGVDKAHPLP
jgi:hypothetical protein